MDKAILLPVLASFCTATASVAQRQGASSVQTTGGFDARLIFRLARRPVWLLGIAAMIGGFLFQLTALRFGPLALVHPSWRWSCFSCSATWLPPAGGG
jgi:hypothetical protein